MKMKEVKELSIQELDQKVADLRKEQFNLRQQAKMGTLDKPTQIKQNRKDIARCLTEKTIKSAKA